MKKRRIGTVILLFLLTVSFAQENKTVFFPSSYGKTKEFNDFSAAEKNAYSVGFINGLAVSGVIGADPKRLAILESCIHPMDSTQVAAILDKYIKDQPELWHEPLAMNSYNALLGACPNLKPTSH